MKAVMVAMAITAMLIVVATGQFDEMASQTGPKATARSLATMRSPKAMTQRIRCPAVVCAQTLRAGGHSANFLVFKDLVEQLWQNRAVAVAAGGEL